MEISSSSIRRSFDNSRKLELCSNPKYRLPKILAAIPVVEEPEKGSKIQAFSFVEASIILPSRGSGF